jgi:hypothetical protein
MLQGLGYPCLEETANPAYRLFLGGATAEVPAATAAPAAVALGGPQG